MPFLNCIYMIVGKGALQFHLSFSTNFSIAIDCRRAKMKTQNSVHCKNEFFEEECYKGDENGK